ncbi:MAG: hypothetical protein HQ567_28510 [Candidatus Nealsonbacteria bacterium]|nr:hypothetical protein [Candidatus Nealsonbacteria bacterium]
MTKLHELRKRLASLRRRRQRIRWETGYSALLLAVLWVAAVALLFDWSFERVMTVPARACVLGVCAAAVIAAFFLFVRPWLGRRESDLDMALLVERTEHIDTDLIAAVQFESAEAPEWGSVQLEQAVIESVALSGKRLNVMRGLSRKELSRRFLLLLLTVAVWGGIYWGARGHVHAFLSRMFLLSGVHYPTDTRIDAIAIKNAHGDLDNPKAPIDWKTVDGRKIDPVYPGKTPIKILFAQQARFEVKCSGELPKKGRVEINTSLSKVHTTVELKPRTDGTLLPGTCVYVGELEPLREKVFYRVLLGDAWTDWGVLGTTQLPIVTVELEVVPPSYARGSDYAGPLKMPIGRRQISVVEGSQVLVKVSSDKRLKQAKLKIVSRTANGANGDQSFDFERVEKDPNNKDNDNRDVWALGSKLSPLHAVVEPIRYALTVLDEDDQPLERPIEGMIRIRADGPPRIAAATNTPFVVPEAVPTIYFHAVDDYGLDRVYATYSVARGSDEQAATGEIPIFSAKSGSQWPTTVHPNRGHGIDLSSLGLQKDDKLTVTLHAVDYRGGRAAKSAEADPLVFQVTDQQGILAAQLEFDRLSAGELNTMIRRQLGIGDSP